MKARVGGIDTGSSIIVQFRAKSQNRIDILLEIMYTLSRIGNSGFKGDVGLYEI